MMKLAVFGLWHLGSVTAACSAASGVETIGIDDDASRVAALDSAQSPLFEPGLDDLLCAGLDSKALSFTTDISKVRDADIVWVCFDTPVDDDDKADIEFVTRRVESLFVHLKDGAVVLVSSQLPVGSIAALERAFAAAQYGKTVSFACSPENLRLGRAIAAFRNPGRIIVGVRDDRARNVLAPLLDRICGKLIWMSIESAEMVKHGLNAFLAMSVTFGNELATLCERVGANAAEVDAGLRSDPRVGAGAYIRPGAAFAGGTLARDVNFLCDLTRDHHVVAPVIGGILASNRAHGQWALAHLRRLLQPLASRTIAVLGLAYTPGTSTLRRSTAIELIRALVKENVRVRTFDPNITALPDDLTGSVLLASSAKDAVRGADALVIATEHPEFCKLSADELADTMSGATILDAGRFLDEAIARHPRLSVISVGR